MDHTFNGNCADIWCEQSFMPNEQQVNTSHTGQREGPRFAASVGSHDINLHIFANFDYNIIAAGS